MVAVKEYSVNYTSGNRGNKSSAFAVTASSSGSEGFILVFRTEKEGNAESFLWVCSGSSEKSCRLTVICPASEREHIREA